MALKGFNVMLQAEDAVGECFVSYGVVAADADAAAKLAEGAAQAEGFWSVELEEVWEPEPEEGDEPFSDIPEVLGRTDPTYLDEDAFGDDDEGWGDDDEEDADGDGDEDVNDEDGSGWSRD